MKKLFNVLAVFILALALFTLSASTWQEKGNKGKNDQPQNKGKEQDKTGKPDKQLPAAKKNNPQQQGNAGANKNPGKENAGQGSANNNKGQGRNDNDRGNDANKGKDHGKSAGVNNGRGANAGGYTWNRENFKDRGKIKNQDKVSICHKFNSNEPAVTIRVSSQALNAHMNHGDVMGDCPAYRDGRFSDIFLRNRSDYYNSLYYSQDQVYYSQSILDYALARLTNSRLQLVNMQNSNYAPADIQRREASVFELEQNVSLLQTLVGVATTLIANKLQN